MDIGMMLAGFIGDMIPIVVQIVSGSAEDKAKAKLDALVRVDKFRDDVDALDLTLAAIDSKIEAKLDAPKPT